MQKQSLSFMGALLFACTICAAEQSAPRKYYGAKLEPVAHVLHGAGQGNVADVQAYRTALGSYTNVLFMEYCSVHLAPGQYAEKLKTKLRDLSGFTAVQLGLKMGMNHPGSDKTHTHYEQDVADGKYDGQLTEFFNQLKALDVPFYIRIGYECNGRWNGYAPEPYKKAFIRITKLIRTSGLNAATVWCVFPDALDKLMTFYPGDEWVDWWAFDPFAVKDMQAAKPFTTEADKHRKPVMIGESTPRNVGVLDGDTSWDAWFAPYFKMIHENPGIKAFCYINWDWSKYPQWKTWGDARLQQNEAVATRYRAEMANPLYLHGTTVQAYQAAMERRQIVIGPQASDMEKLAAKELQRYLWQVSGTFLEITTGGEPAAGSFLIGQRQTNPLIERVVTEGKVTVSPAEPGPQGYVLKHVAVGNRPALVIAGSDAVGCLYGVYGLLEAHLGITFSLSGDVLPDERKSLDLPALDERHVPSVPIRGFIPWSIFPQTTNYSWADWKAIIDQMAKLRLNLLMIHNYNGESSGVNELYHNFPIDGKLPRVGNGHAKGGYMIGGPAWNPWEYRFKGRDLIDDCDFGAEAMTHGESLSNEELFARGVTMFQRVIDYAHTRGVKMALGTDVNLCMRGNAERLDGVTRGKMAAEPAIVKARIGQVIRDYPALDYFIAFSWEGMPKTAETLPIWEGLIKLIHEELKAKAPSIGLAVSSWGIPPEWVAGLPPDVICAPIAGYSARPQDGKIFGTRDFWACPWMEKDNDDSMFYFPFRMLLSQTIDAWQKRSSNTKGLYALTWRLTDAIDAKLWYIAHAPWDSKNLLKTSREAYHAWATANYGREAADAVTPIINENEAFACNMAEMGGARPFREFASIMWSHPVATFKCFGVPSKTGVVQRAAASFTWNNGGRKQKVDTPESHVDEISSGIWLEYAKTDFGEGADHVLIDAAAERGARVEVRLNNADGPVLGQGVLPKTKGWRDFQRIHLPIKPTSGIQTVVIAFSEVIYPRQELTKAEQQLAVVDACMAKASPGQRQRLSLLRTRLAAVRDHIRLNLEFPEYTLENLPGAMESWVMNYIRRVDDISSLGTLTSIEGRYVQHTYLRDKVLPCYEKQALRPPLDVEARGTVDGARIGWRDVDPKVSGFNVYRDGQLLTKNPLAATQDYFNDQGSGDFTYTVTAVSADGKESLPSVKTRCLAGPSDREPPLIVMVSPPLSTTKGQPAPIKARLVDNRSYEQITATLHYRTIGSKVWKSMAMTRRVRAIFTATLAGTEDLEYYIEANDGSQISRYPLAAPERNLSMIVCDAPASNTLAVPEASAKNGSLIWKQVPGAHWYRIYRGRTPDFQRGPESYLTFAAQGSASFKDMEEDFDGSLRQGVYYYRVTAMDRHGFEGLPSLAVPLPAATVMKATAGQVAGGVHLLRNPQVPLGMVATAFIRPGDQLQFSGVREGTSLRLRYSNGNSEPTRCGLYVDGKRVTTLEFPVTFSRSDDTDGYANGVRLSSGGGAKKGDWQTFATLEVSQPVKGQVALRVDAADAEANRGNNCCMIERMDLE